MKKRAQQGVITAVLLILLVLAAILIVFNLMHKTVKSSTEKMSMSEACMTKAKIDVVNSCYYNISTPGYELWRYNITIRNFGKDDYSTQDFLLHFTRNEATDPTPLLPVSQKLESLTQNVFYIEKLGVPEDNEKLTLIPRIIVNDNVKDCYETAVEFESYKCY